jgi:hypothetical protein
MLKPGNWFLGLLHLCVVKGYGLHRCCRVGADRAMRVAVFFCGTGGHIAGTQKS